MRRAVISVVALVSGVVLPAAGATPAPGSSAAGGHRPPGTAQLVAARPCRPIRISVPLAAGDDVGVLQTCPGIQPGARLLIGDPTAGLIDSSAQYCTMNFVFIDTRGRYYVGTAGHCVLDHTPSVMPDEPPSRPTDAWAFNAQSDPYRIGAVVFAIRTDVKDFALVRLDHGQPFSAQVCVFGGPIAMNTSRDDAPTLLHHVGQGFGLGDVTPARTALAGSLQDEDRVLAAGVAFVGDSGSPVLDATSAAIGVVVSIEASPSVDQVGVLGITRLRRQLDVAGALLGTQFFMLTAPTI